jgi:transcriptional regulator with XRE-family HTH domain
MGRQATIAIATIPLRGVPRHTRLKLAIIASGIPQGDIAKALRISIYRLSRIVRGHQPPTADERDQLADILGQSVRALFR